jgi:hypothetical protein
MPQQVELPQDIKVLAQKELDDWVASLTERTMSYVRTTQRIARGAQPEAGEPWIPGPPPYLFWDMLVAGPYQIFHSGTGPYRPSKIIRDGEFAFMLGVLWRNPGSLGGGPSAAELMNSRDFRINFELMNLTTVSNAILPGINGTFADYPTNFLTPFILPFMPSNPSGEGHPDLYEMNVTCDLTSGAQSMAAFATWVYDPDTEPGFLFRPTMTQGWEHERPIRFMVYTK